MRLSTQSFLRMICRQQKVDPDQDHGSAQANGITPACLMQHGQSENLYLPQLQPILIALLYHLHLYSNNARTVKALIGS